MKNKLTLDSLKNSKFELSEMEKSKATGGIDFSYEYANTGFKDPKKMPEVDLSVIDFCI